MQKWWEDGTTNVEPIPILLKGSNTNYIIALIVVAITTAMSLALRPYLNPTDLVMVYLVGVIIVATRCSRRAAILTSMLSVAAFDFFCVPPYYTFAVAHYGHLITFIVMLVVALLISAMTSRIRGQTSAAMERAAQTSALYRLANELAGHSRAFEFAKAASAVAGETLALNVTVFLPTDAGMISFNRRTSDHLSVPTDEQTVAQWVFDQGENAGKGTKHHPNASALYIPVKTGHTIFGVMAVLAPGDSDPILSERAHLLKVFASQTALAIAKATAASAARNAEVRIEAETLRTSLLSAVSHDLRTPLASITGAAATLRMHWDRLETTMREELLQSIGDEADHLNRLLSNLIEVTRLDSGVRLNKEAFPLEEVIGAALHRLRSQLAGRSVRTSIPMDLPLVGIDDALMEQVFINLVENALKYTPNNTDIEIAASSEASLVHVEVRDSGAGFKPGDEDLVFDRFFRGRSDNIRGAGLGLTICRAIVEAHGGSIRAANRAGGGAVIHFTLPASNYKPSLTARRRGTS